MNYEECREMLSRYSFVELRLDNLTLSADEVRALCGLPAHVIATCRLDAIEKERRHALLESALEGGARYIDLEIELPENEADYLRDFAHKHGAAVIFSYHNFSLTPSCETLQSIVRQCFARGADIAKIACQVKSPSDNARLFGLLGMPEKLVVIGMGPLGRITRVLGPSLGSQWTYVSPAAGKETAGGQLTVHECENAIRILGQLTGEG